MLDRLKKIGSDVISSIKETGSQVIDKTKEIGGDILSGAKETTEKVGDIDFTDTTKDFVSKLGSFGKEKIWGEPREGVPTIKETYEETKRKTKNFLINNYNSIKNDVKTFDEHAESFIERLREGGETLSDWGESVAKKEERLYRLPYSLKTKELETSVIDHFVLDSFSRLSELPVKAAMIAGAEISSFIESGRMANDFDHFLELLTEKNGEQMGPIDARRVGFEEKTVTTAAKETWDMIDAGFTPLEASLIVGGSKTLDVAVGASITQSMAGLTNKLLKGTPNSIKKVDAWKRLWGPKNKKKLDTNFKKLAHQFHPDKPMGNTEMMKIINNDYTTLKNLGMPTKKDIIQYNAWRVTEPLSRGTVITNILKHSPLIKNSSGKTVLRIKPRKWEEIWRDMSTFPNRFKRPDLIKTGLRPYELANAENILQLPGYRPIPGQGPPIGLSIQNWQKVGGTREKVANELLKKYSKERADAILRYKGTNLLSDVNTFGLKEATSDIMLSDVPDLSHLKVSESYNKVREAIKSEEVTPIFPKTDKGIQELSPNLYKVKKDSSYFKASKKQKVKEAENIGAAIIKDNKGNDIPVIRDSGFYASEDLLKYDVGDIYNQNLSWLNWANQVDKTFARREGVFGPLTRTQFKAREAMAAREKAITNYEDDFIRVADNNNIKPSKKNLETATEVQLIAKSDDWIGKSVSKLKKIYPKLKKYDDGMLNLAKKIQENMSETRLTANKIRASMGKKPMGKIENYVNDAWKTGFFNRGIMQDKGYKHGDSPSFTVPDTVQNRWAKKRLYKIPEKFKEKNAAILYSKYIRDMNNEIYMNPIIEQVKADQEALSYMGKNKNVEYLNEIINSNILGRPGTIDRVFGVEEGTYRKKGLDFIRSMRIKADLVGNLSWNLTTQPISYAILTSKQAGLINTFAKAPVEYLFNKDLRKEIANDHTMVLKSKRAHSAAYKGNIDAYDQSIYKNNARKASDILTTLAHAEEQHLTAMSYVAGKAAGKELGYEGDDLLYFASKTAGETQQMYDRGMRPPILNNSTVRSVFPYQSWSLSTHQHLRQIYGKGKMPADAQMRFGMATKLIIGTIIGNEYYKALKGYNKTTPGSFIPFVGSGVDMVLDEILGTEFSYGRTRGIVPLYNDVMDVARAVGDIKEATSEISSHEYEDIKEFSRETARYVAEGNLEHFRNVAVRWLSGASGMGGGSQINRLVDTIFDAERGYVEDLYKRKWFPVELKDIPMSAIFGRHSTLSAREAKERDERLDKIQEEEGQIEKDRNMEARRIVRDIEEMSKEDGLALFRELQEYSPLMAKKVGDILDKEEPLTTTQSRFSGMNVQDGARARGLYKFYKEIPFEQRKKELNELIEVGVITPTVKRQLEEWYNWK